MQHTPAGSGRSAVTIRPYRPSDAEALRDICVRTGHSGGDARGYFDDPEVLPAVYATPYAEHDPGLVFVADNGERAIGYVLGAASGAAYFRFFREEWLPVVAQRFPEPEGTPKSPDDRLRWVLHHPERMFVAEFEDDYPAHLHIDLLPEGQGRGLGRALMETFLAELRRRGLPGVHLGMNPANTRARAFYDRMGFTELVSPEPQPGSLHLGLRL